MLSNTMTTPTVGSSNTISTFTQLVSLATFVIGVGYTLKNRYDYMQKLKRKIATLEKGIEEDLRIAAEFQEVTAKTELQYSTQYSIHRELLARAKEERLVVNAEQQPKPHPALVDEDYVPLSCDETADPKDALEEVLQHSLDTDNFINEISNDLFNEQREKTCALNSIKMTR